MDKDLELLKNYPGSPILRIYSWEPKCISLGYSQEIDEEINVEKAKKQGWDVVIRPTGGGIVFHNSFEVSYSFIVGADDLPKGLIPSFLMLSEIILGALKSLGINAKVLSSRKEKGKSENPTICFSGVQGYELVYKGRKLVGAAQKRNKQAVLQQGSILVKNDLDETILKILKKPFNLERYNKQVISLEEILSRKITYDEICKALTHSSQMKALGYTPSP
jgi:lipoate-protein ligase A